MTQTCAHCDHWNADHKEDWQFTALGWGACTGIPFRDRFEEAHVLGELAGDEREIAEALAYQRVGAVCVDGSGYRAQVFTAPGFSCANWKAKPPPIAEPEAPRS